MSKSKQPITDALKKAIAESGLSYLELERATGVQRASISRFVRGERSLRLDMADKLAEHFEVECRRISPKGR